jgi:hypothetical protein
MPTNGDGDNGAVRPITSSSTPRERQGAPKVALPGMCALRHPDQSGALNPALLLQPLSDKSVSGIACSSVSAMTDRLTLTRAFEGPGR